MTKRSAYALECLPLVLCFGCILGLFFEILVSGKSLYGSDFTLYFRPILSFVHDHVRQHGVVPFWNPYQFSGTPIVGNIQASLFYPLGFLYYLIPLDRVYLFSVMMHSMVGCLGMYVFMRSLSAHRAASFFAATVFLFNGFFLGHLYAGHLTFIQNYVWIPLIFFLLNQFGRKGDFAYGVGAGLVLGIQILGGFPQIAFYTILSASLFLIFLGARCFKESRPMGGLKFGAGLALFILIGFSLAAVQVLPTLELTRFSTRGGGVSYAMATYESLHPKELLAFLIPDLFGSAVDQTYWRSQEIWHFWESCGYVGILPLFFLFITAKETGSGRSHVFFALLLFLSLFLALGKHNPLYPFIYRLPGFNSFRLPTQIIFLYVFSVSVLSGLGLSRILDGNWRLARGFWIFLSLSSLLLGAVLIGLTFFRLEFFFTLFKNFSEGPVTHINMGLLYERLSHSIQKAGLVFFVSLFLLALAKHRRVSPSILSFLACTLTLADLYLFGVQFVRTHEFAVSPEKQCLLSQLSKTAANGRVVTSDVRFSTNDGVQYRFPSVLGYDPLMLKRYADYVLSSQGYPPNEHVVNLSGIHDPEAKLLKLLNVRQVVAGGQLKELENGVPYALLVPNEAVKPVEEILQFMKSDEFDPRKTVVLSKQPEQEHTILEQNRPLSGACHVLSHSSEEIRFRISCNQPAYLVISEIWYPGWVASVDGREREVICGNYLFRVVPVEEGDHDVKLYFVSWSFRIGATLCLATLLAGLWFLWRYRARDSLKGLPGRRSAAA